MLSRAAILAPALAVLTSAQGPGRGISKSTYACSESAATNAYAWEKKYLPVDEAADDCPDRTCTCGKQSRVALKVSSSANATFSRRGHVQQGVSPGFGIHCTYAAGKDASRAKANGGTTEEQVEKRVAEAIGDWSKYDTDVNVRAWSSYSTALFAESGLDWYITQFKNDGVNYHAGSWKSGSSTYWSVLVLIPGTSVVLELQGTCTLCGKAEEKKMPDGYVGYSGVLPATTPNLRTGADAEQGLMYATTISRAISNLTTAKTYMKKVMGVDPVSESTLSDGAKIADYQVSSSATVHIRYIERSGETGSKTTGWFEKLLLDTANKYQTNYDSCWPIWGDYHYAWDQQSKQVLGMVTAAGKLGFPYRSFAGASFGPSNAYVVEPSGMWIQLDGPTQGVPAPSGGGFQPDYCYTFCE